MVELHMVGDMWVVVMVGMMRDDLSVGVGGNRRGNLAANRGAGWCEGFFTTER